MLIIEPKATLALMLDGGCANSITRICGELGKRSFPGLRGKVSRMYSGLSQRSSTMKHARS